jgi:CheY-like chemotaxis protein
LLVEDSATIRGYLRRTFQAFWADSEIAEVEDGLMALDEVAARPPDVVVTDLQMPRLDGREFLRRAFALGQLRSCVVLVLSSSITPELRKEFAAKENLVFLRKPVTSEDIRAALKRQLP